MSFNTSHFGEHVNTTIGHTWVHSTRFAPQATNTLHPLTLHSWMPGLGTFGSMGTVVIHPERGRPRIRWLRRQVDTSRGVVGGAHGHQAPEPPSGPPGEQGADPHPRWGLFKYIPETWRPMLLLARRTIRYLPGNNYRHLSFRQTKG